MMGGLFCRTLLASDNHAVFQASPLFTITNETILETHTNCQYHFAYYYNLFFSPVLFYLIYKKQHAMRYVLLKHEEQGDFHADFLLDCGRERLLTWQISDTRFASFLVGHENFFDFTTSPNNIIHTICSKCRRIPDHRWKYLDFSGELGDHRGYVTRAECGQWELRELTARRLVIKTVGTRLADHSSISRQWQFEPPVEITLNPDGTSPDRLMQQLPPPGDENWVVSWTFLC